MPWCLNRCKYSKCFAIIGKLWSKKTNVEVIALRYPRTSFCIHQVSYPYIA